jgi:hypothetical protein
MTGEETVRSSILDEVEVGETLDPFEYVITKEMLDEYRAIVDDPSAAYPTVAGRHSLRAFVSRYGEGRVMNAGTDSTYFNPVVAGKRIRVEAKIIDKYVRREKPYIVVESIAIDEDGRLIEKSHLIAKAAQDAKPLFGEIAEKWEKH